MRWDAAVPTDPGDAGTSAIVGLVNYGVLGLLVVLGIAGLISFRPHTRSLEAERDRALIERDKADAQRDAMAETFQKELLPVLTKFLTTTEALLPLLQRMADRSGGEHK